ncbi:MAG TPA: hypothetical protein ENH82_07660 [bacterium]|nr:hypothetical protein [bacterium]
MTYSFELMLHKPSKGDPPWPSIAQIYVKTHTSDEKGHIFITPECVSMRELEEQIDRLQQELEIIRKKAIKKLSKKK